MDDRMTSWRLAKCPRCWLASLVLFATATACARAQSDADFYAGKTISLIIGSGEAGVYDLGARLMARYLRKYIPGNPNIVPRNMPGASSVVAAEYLYNVAPRDGLVIGTAQPTIVLNKSFDAATKYDPGKFAWVGRLQPTVLVGVAWRASGVNTIADARRHDVVVSASGASGTSAIVPWALNRVAGTRFTVVRGYESQRPQFLAMERGEVAGIGSASLSDVLDNGEWMKKNLVSILYTIARQRSKLVAEAPAIVELTSVPIDRAALELLGSGSDIGQTMMAPPNVPEGRLAVLRRAFRDMAADREFVAEAARVGINVDMMGGAELSALVSSASEAPVDVLDRLRAIAQPQ